MFHISSVLFLAYFLQLILLKKNFSRLGGSFMYQPKDSSKSPRFCGVRTFMRLEQIKTTDNVDFAVLGVPFDTAASNRTGQRYGPQHIRNFSVLLRP
jgi:agmatinase